ncbi:RUN and SH3 domain-containing protein 1 [Geospiza fortis]|uniref:RUN and SH3 domain-containing protein 1 n=1 Tax=Geospiza fortis TaxID=48883 RepID=A0A8N5F280_GEOFO|nr:RUN and SH3 domain-containing protein 1 [Geospiza fortis]
MLAPKKGLLCNLNHIHLQHISLGLHLSRHPELQDGSTGGGEQTGCTQCPENREPVDANSNNPSVKCRCCESHAPEPETLGLQNPEDFPCLHSGDEEEAASPCDPPCDLASSSSSSSSSVSSCSDFSLDDSPVSVYCKEFARAESQSPDKQLNVIPTENAWHGESLGDREPLADGESLGDGESLADQHRTCHGRDANHNSPVPPRATKSSVASKSPDSLCSINSLDSHCDELSPSSAAPETTGTCTDLDPNCNPLPEPGAPESHQELCGQQEPRQPLQHQLARFSLRRAPHGEQTKALLVAVSSAVDKVIAHFSTARNLVQKAQLGDSRLNPDVGYLLLHTLCPALYALVEDGLKPFQKDVITGQRKNSPWSVVEASVKTGPSTRSLHSLCWHVAGLAPLSSSRQKFHAFILGLLNIKQLELWISHLQKSPGVISVLYSPTAFFALSQGPLPHLADELLLLIQPLSVLTFHLDLLFEHHHLSVDVRPLSRRLQSPLSPVPVRGSLGGQGGAAGHSLEDETPPDALGRVGGTGGRSQATMGGLVPAPPVGAALQQTLQHVLRWGDQLSRTLLGSDTPQQSHGPQEGTGGTGAGLSGWWGQLSQSSRIYTLPSKEKSPSVWWTKLRLRAGEPSPGQAGQSQISLSEPRATELQLLQTKAGPERSGPKPSSSTDTSGTSSPEDLFLPAGTGAFSKLDDATAGKNLLAAPPEPPASRNQAAPSGPETADPPTADKGSWLGWLFGATNPSSRSFPSSPDAASARCRHFWCRAVRALCDHTGTADGHLSFHKGDILELLSTVDEDWIRCCHGNSTGLVPVGYTSLIL